MKSITNTDKNAINGKIKGSYNGHKWFCGWKLSQMLIDNGAVFGLVRKIIKARSSFMKNLILKFVFLW